MKQSVNAELVALLIENLPPLINPSVLEDWLKNLFRTRELLSQLMYPPTKPKLEIMLAAKRPRPGVRSSRFYDLITQVGLYWHSEGDDNQLTGGIRGEIIYQYFVDHPDEHILQLTRNDLIEIKARGPECFEVFSKYFLNGQAISVFAWGTFKKRSGKIYVSYLVFRNDKVVLKSRPIDKTWTLGEPALYFKNLKK